MDEFGAVMTVMLIDSLDKAGLLDEIVDEVVNGTGEICLGWYDETDTDRAVVCAAFQVLGQEIADHCHPAVAAITISKIVNLRNKTIEVMKDIPR